MKISEIIATEVMVPANPGVVNSQAVDKPLHKLSSAGHKAWSKQFDEIPKCILQVKTDSGLIGLGELYRDHDWRAIETIAQILVGMDLSQICLQNFPRVTVSHFQYSLKTTAPNPSSLPAGNTVENF